MMAEIINMPKLGFDMAEGTLVRWVIQEGEKVTKGAVLAEIETDKATVEVAAVQDGVMRRHLVSEGTVVPVNTPIAVVGSADETIDLPALLGEVAEEKTTSDQQPLPATARPTREDQGPALPSETQADISLLGGVRASPIARKMAEEMGLDLKLIAGTGPGGRITKKDIETYQPVTIESKAAIVAPQPEVQPPAAMPFITPLTPPVPETVSIPLGKLRAIIGKRMQDAKQQIPHFYVTHEYNVGSLLDLRKEINAFVPDEQKVSVNDFIVKAVALSLRQFPNLNASLQGNQIIHHGNVNIGVAVAVDEGLLTVVCKDADRKSLRQIAVEIREMASRARAGRVRPEDIEGSTFTVSNLGMFAVESFSAIINPPEAAILAVGSANQVPVIEDGMVSIGWRMKATISVDHRVSDGAEAARFLQALTDTIENPLKLLI